MAQKITDKELREYVREHIGKFHATRLKRLEALELNTVLRKKNPYLFKAKNLTTAPGLVKNLLDAYLSSQEEGVFGGFLEGLAVFINQQAYGGWKSSAEGIDLEFTKPGVRYIVSIKSGPNWGNSSQIKKMKEHFIQAQKILRQADKNMNIQAVNGCCYGRDSRPDKGGYYKYCGQKFWEFISNDEDLYQSIIKPLGYRAKQKNDKFMQGYVKVVNQFTMSFMERFCQNGVIQWEEIIRLNSAEKPPGKVKKK
ncbi:MAG: PmeII family type II restriction endonuclease [Gammaproteobacteria bacterium]